MQLNQEKRLDFKSLFLITKRYLPFDAPVVIEGGRTDRVVHMQRLLEISERRLSWITNFFVGDVWKKETIDARPSPPTIIR